MKGILQKDGNVKRIHGWREREGSSDPYCACSYSYNSFLSPTTLYYYLPLQSSYHQPVSDTSTAHIRLIL